MNISSISNIQNIPQKVAQRVFDAIPNIRVSSDKANSNIAWIGEKISSPENRLIMGATALMLQPAIDLNNTKVDEETRKISTARTIAKIIAGTSTGVLVRSACIRAIDAFTQIPTDVASDAKFKNLKTLFTPSEDQLKNLKNGLGQYKKSLGTILAIFVMMFTNFLIDAPFTKFLTNKFIDKIQNNKSIQENTYE